MEAVLQRLMHDSGGNEIDVENFHAGIQNVKNIKPLDPIINLAYAGINTSLQQCSRGFSP